MHTHFSSLFTAKILRIASFGALCVFGSFMLGIETAGEVQTFETSSATEIEQIGVPYGTSPDAGDVDGSGIVDLRDVISILEIAQGYESPSAQELRADPNGDNRLTVEDALRVLTWLSHR